MFCMLFVLANHVQSCLLRHMDYIPLSLGFPSKNTGVVCHFLQRTFPTQRSNPHFLCLAGGLFTTELLEKEILGIHT